VKLLLVGDPHVVAEELADCERLMDLVEETIKAERPDQVVFMGDLHHNHAVIALDVMAFWRRRLERLRMIGPKPWLIVGNHDRSGDSGNPNHALLAYEGLAHVVDGSADLVDIHLGNAPRATLIGYTGTPMIFDEYVKKSQARVILCHETFNGAQYDNGFYAPEGIDPGLYPGKVFISGHIHTPQKVGDNVTYIGAPRWRTVSDAGVRRRALALIGIYGDGDVNFLKLIPTNSHCTPIVHVVVNEGDIHENHPQGPRYIVDIHGSPDFIKDRAAAWKEKGARIRTFPVRQETAAVRESQGIRQALASYLSQYQPQHGTTPEALGALYAARLGALS
jgi:DNA repair exonuclease SbcCD nuclease subunit